MIYRVNNHTWNSIKSAFTWETAKGLYDLGKAIADNRVSLKEIGKAIIKSTLEPINYLINNTNKVFRGNPADSHVYTYGKQLGNVLQQVAGSGAAFELVTKAAPRLIKFLKKLPADLLRGRGKLVVLGPLGD